jgi:hypothetical protein
MLVSHFHQYGIWIGYWTSVCLALTDLHPDNPLILKHDFWPQCRVDIPTSEARLLGNREVVRSSTRTAIMLGLLVFVPHHLSMLQWFIMRVICSY